MTLKVVGESLIGEINGTSVLQARDSKLDVGAIGLIVEEGRSATQKIQVVRAV